MSVTFPSRLAKHPPGCQNMVMSDTIFTRIIKGELPCHKIYEDNHCLAFMDIHPVHPGHVLVVSKQQIDHLWDLPDDAYQAMMTAAKKIAQHQRQVLGVERVGVQVIGVDVPHAHLHLIPFNDVAEYRRIVDMQAEPDHAALAELANKLTLL